VGLGARSEVLLTSDPIIPSYYNEEYGAYTVFNNFYQRDMTTVDNQSPQYQAIYQKILNPDYMTFDRYSVFKPHTPQYDIEDDATDFYKDANNCGHCVQHGFTMCSRSKVFAATVDEIKDTPASVCCIDEASCKKYKKDSSYSCSTEYTDDIFKYNICPFVKEQCGSDQWVRLGSEGEIQKRAIRALEKGETCTYKIKASCGSPGFRSATGADWVSKIGNFNVTWVEFETDDESSIPEDYLQEEFIYHNIDMEELIFKETTSEIRTQALRERARKGIYSTADMGWKMFNNEEQSAQGRNGYRQLENDPTCKDRYMIASFTSLADRQSMNVEMKSEKFSAYPVLKDFRVRGGA